MKNLSLFFLLLYFAGHSFAQAITGKWYREAHGQTEIYEIGIDSIGMAFSMETMPATYTKVAVYKIKYNADKKSGRIVLGPYTLRRGPYQVLIFTRLDKNLVYFYKEEDDKSYETGEAALKSEITPDQTFFRLFFSDNYYQKIKKMPPMPEPDEVTFSKIAGEVLALLKKQQADKTYLNIDDLMNHYLLNKGYNPFSSFKVFTEARVKYQAVEEINAKILEIRKLTERK